MRSPRQTHQPLLLRLAQLEMLLLSPLLLTGMLLLEQRMLPPLCQRLLSSPLPLHLCLPPLPQHLLLRELRPPVQAEVAASTLAPGLVLQRQRL